MVGSRGVVQFAVARISADISARENQVGVADFPYDEMLVYLRFELVVVVGVWSYGHRLYEVEIHYRVLCSEADLCSARCLEEFFLVGVAQVNTGFGGCVVLVDCAREIVSVGVDDVLGVVAELQPCRKVAQSPEFNIRLVLRNGVHLAEEPFVNRLRRQFLGSSVECHSVAEVEVALVGDA